MTHSKLSNVTSIARQCLIPALLPVCLIVSSDTVQAQNTYTDQGRPISYPDATATPDRPFDNSNIQAVQNGGVSPSFLVPNDHYCLDSIRTYHWNNGSGQIPGTIGIEDRYGHRRVWPAVASSGSGAPNVNWRVTVTDRVPLSAANGPYKVIDSDPSTWSQNAASQGRGFATLQVKDCNEPKDGGGPVESPPPSVDPSLFTLAPLNPNQIAHIDGQYSGGFGYRVSASDVPVLSSIFADYPDTPSASPLILLENGHPIGTAHSQHADIERLGQGRFSHWRHSELRFSTSDNSDPRTNGRSYSIAVPKNAVLAYIPLEQVVKMGGEASNSVGYRIDPSAIFSIISHLPADTSKFPNTSRLVVLEDGVPLSIGHTSFHALIQKQGRGRYSHWNDGNSTYLVFSSSDNSDPRTNGRQYSIAVTTSN